MTTPLDDRRPPRLNKRQQQAVETRERMLRAAAEVFAERGYQAASVGAITTRADTAHGTFYLYFRNKDDAFAQVFEGIADQIRERSRAGLSDDRAAGVRGVVHGLLSVFHEHAGIIRAMVEGMMASPTVEQLWRDVRADFAGRLALHLEHEQAVGAVRPLDPQAAAQALASMAEWYAFTHLVLGDPTSPASQDDLEDAVGTLADLWFHAVYGTTAALDGP